MTQTLPNANAVPIWRDLRVLQWVLQIVALLAALAVLLWLYGNYTANAERQNIPTSFNFLDNPAQFQITGNSLSMSAPIQDALVQGFLNTLRIAVAGIATATVLGTLIGMARLSGNWLVRQMATVYVEAVRNIPLLIFVIAGYLIIVLNIMPQIQEAWEPLGLAVISNRGIAIPWFTGSGVMLLVSFVAALGVGWAVARWRQSVFARTGAPPRDLLFGGLAALVVFVVGWLIFGLDITMPSVEGRATVGGIRIDPAFFAIFFALVVYTASHIAEIVRGSIQAVPKGQTEAANALALSGAQRMRMIVLPQAFRIAMPPLGNQYVNLIKNSSLGAFIGYYDLTLVTQTTVAGGSPAVPAFAIALVCYLFLSLVTSAGVNLLNRRFALVER